MADDPPKPTLAPEHTSEDVAIRHAMHDLAWLARTFVANAMRVTAGAGDPYRLAQQAFELGQAIQDAPSGTLVGHINDAIADAVSDGRREPGDFDDIEDATDDIEQAILRIVAARMLHQTVQVTRRENDLSTAICRLEDIREKNRREFEAEMAALRAKQNIKPSIPRKRRKPSVRVQPSRSVPQPNPIDEEAELAACKNTSEFIRKRQEQLRRARGED
ncbi:hypothetical protein M8312_11940 [Sphingomonas sp. KRR8]|uniref:hypothetical protein n=1 Tax=Sphingomonas sp. KRR8 TaxID=2942996 RepID=UPI00201FDCF1|nr:hypothetical protein [Sphingomonas sp. KRR8]URD60487.1 hypothetical protein M8312_11940 [Sphingomonas sp. KRR8]